MWKFISVRLATSILMDIPVYQSLTQEKIHCVLERAFVPNLSRYKVFGVSNTIEDIILIEGVVFDYNTKECYIAPCYIPRTVQKIVLPRSNLTNFVTKVEPRLLIIPARDVDEFDIMEKEEEISEIVSTLSTKCLQHAIQQRSSQTKRRRRRQNNLDMGRRRVKHSDSKISTSPSMYYSKSRMTNVSSEAELQTISIQERNSYAVGSYVISENDQKNSNVSHPFVTAPKEKQPEEQQLKNTINDNISRKKSNCSKKFVQLQDLEYSLDDLPIPDNRERVSGQNNVGGHLKEHREPLTLDNLLQMDRFFGRQRKSNDSSITKQRKISDGVQQIEKEQRSSLLSEPQKETTIRRKSPGRVSLASWPQSKSDNTAKDYLSVNEVLKKDEVKNNLPNKLEEDREAYRTVSEDMPKSAEEENKHVPRSVDDRTAIGEHGKLIVKNFGDDATARKDIVRSPNETEIFPDESENPRNLDKHKRQSSDNLNRGRKKSGGASNQDTLDEQETLKGIARDNVPTTSASINIEMKDLREKSKNRQGSITNEKSVFDGKGRDQSVARKESSVVDTYSNRTKTRRTSSSQKSRKSSTPDPTQNQLKPSDRANQLTASGKSFTGSHRERKPSSFSEKGKDTLLEEENEFNSE